jgi:hypothetical protein
MTPSDDVDDARSDRRPDAPFWTRRTSGGTPPAWPEVAVQVDRRVRPIAARHAHWRAGSRNARGERHAEAGTDSIRARETPYPRGGIMTRSGSQPAWDPWTYRRDIELSGNRMDLVGFDVEATDGSIGRIDEATSDVGSSYVVVDTGPWIFGSKVMLPAGTISRVDRNERKVYVYRTKDEIKNAPKFDKETYTSRDYRDRLGEYYGRFRY